MLLSLFYNQGKWSSENFYDFQDHATNKYRMGVPKQLVTELRTSIFLLSAESKPVTSPSLAFLTYLSDFCFLLTAAGLSVPNVLSFSSLLTTVPLASSLISSFSPSSTLTLLSISEPSTELHVLHMLFHWFPVGSPHSSKKETSGQKSSKSFKLGV